MIVFKEEFIKRYIDKLAHKVDQELKEKLPDKGFFAEMIEQSDQTVIDLLNMGKK